jgi:hypothetical protein
MNDPEFEAMNEKLNEASSLLAGIQEHLENFLNEYLDANIGICPPVEKNHPSKRVAKVIIGDFEGWDNDDYVQVGDVLELLSYICDQFTR